MIKIAESTHYEVFKEYEQVFLNIKQINEIDKKLRSNLV